MANADSEMGLLKRYDRYKLDLADAIRLLQENAKNAGSDSVAGSLKGILKRLAADQFNVVFVGQFSRGKSTVMNALIGTDLLPVGVVPLTSVITVVKYGSRERAVIRYPNSLLTREVKIAELPQYVTQTDNPGNAKGVELAEIQVPSDLLLRGVCLVDTPGLGSAIEENTSTTERFLPEADAFVVVTSVDSPVTGEEARLLELAVSRGNRVFLVVNKADLLSGPEIVQSADYARKVASKFSPGIEVYVVSAQQELLASKGQKNAADRDEWLRFESDLQTFLAQNRAAPFLLNNCDRVISAVQRDGASPALGEALHRIETIRNEIAAATNIRVNPGRQLSCFARPTETCFVCNEVIQELFNFLSKYQYAISIDPVVRNRHADINGFCQLHTWQYEKLASPRGVCNAYPPLLRRVAEFATRIENFLAHGSCPACVVQKQAEQNLLKTLENNAHAGQENKVLCIPHLDMLKEMGNDKSVRQFEESLSAGLTRMAETMQRYSMKQEALRRDLQTEEEQHVHRRALALLVGQPQVKTGN